MGNQIGDPAKITQPKKNTFIRPAPGYRGIKIFKKHKVHIYDESTSQIYILNTYPDMQIKEISRWLERHIKHPFDLYQNKTFLQEDLTFDQLNLQETALIRVVTRDSKDESTTMETPKLTAGPKLGSISAPRPLALEDSVQMSMIVEPNGQHPVFGIDLRKYNADDVFLN